MNKLLLFVFLAALAGVALYFSFSSQIVEPRALPLSGAEIAPETPRIVEPMAADAPLVEQPLELTAPSAPREVRGLEVVPALPPDRICTLSVHAQLPGGTPRDDATEVLVVGKLPEDVVIEAELAVLGPTDPTPKWLLARVPLDPRGVTEIPLEKRAGSVAVSLLGHFAYAEPVQGVDVSGERAEATLTAQLGACVRGRLIAPADASDAEREMLRCELDLGSDPMEGQGIQTGARPLVVDRETKAVEGGTFEFRGVPPGKALTLSGRPAHLAAFKTEIAALTAGRAFETEIKLQRGAQLSGRVVDETGAGVAGAKLKVRGDAVMLGFGGQKLREGASREDGSFTLEAVAAGKVNLDVAKDGFLDSTKTLEAFEGARVDDLVLHLAAGARIAGHVRWQDGTPCATASIDVGFDQANLQGMGALNARFGAKGSGKSDEQGNFSVGGLGKGPFTVKATALPAGETSEDAPKWIAVVDAVKPGTLEVELRLRPPSDIAG
ncbi:MAG TPA: carboxypeptidase-like regulatory domain-containing protein, partial [Planctomycetota bacterium]|nr:carboxypeptidase-like regulatory domain-containing protein [Planctomycetota bacterium]